MENKIYNIGLAISQFYPDLAQNLEKEARTILKNQKIKTGYVGGCAELPLMSQWLFEKNCDAVICLGVVIRGETSHYDSVCRIFENGIVSVQLKYSKPCLCGVLMTENKNQAHERIKKGKEVAQTCLQMLESFHNLSSNED